MVGRSSDKRPDRMHGVDDVFFKSDPFDNNFADDLAFVRAVKLIAFYIEERVLPFAGDTTDQFLCRFVIANAIGQVFNPRGV